MTTEELIIDLIEDLIGCSVEIGWKKPAPIPSSDSGRYHFRGNECLPVPHFPLSRAMNMVGVALLIPCSRHYSSYLVVVWCISRQHGNESRPEIWRLHCCGKGDHQHIHVFL
jgi:hypothetical protein